MPATLTPLEVSYDVKDLKKFIENDPDPIISFYGGEPLLRINLLEKIMDSIDATFVIQTNGTFIHKLKSDYLKKFDSILVSLDGTESVTDYYRGKGVFQRVIKDNLRNIRSLGFNGDLIARMAVSQQSDIFRDVMFLLDHQNPVFDHVHWQLNAFWAPDGSWNDMEHWINNSYNPGITRLVEYWLKHMVKTGLVLGIVPFLAIMNSLLRNEPSKLRCGSGIDAFAIATSGSLLACPISPEYESMHVGNIHTNTPESIKNSLLIEEPCTSCEVYSICGGRCLFVNQIPTWKDEEFKAICSTVKHLIKELQRIQPNIQNLIKQNKLAIEDFYYPKYNNGCEIIP